MRPVPLWTLLLVALLAVVGAILFGRLVEKAATSGRAGVVAIAIAEVPHDVKRILKGHAPWEPFRPYYGGAYPRLPNGFWRNPGQDFVDPGFVLLTAFDEHRLRPVVRLIRLSDGRVVHEYRPDVDGINARSRFRSALVDLARDRGVGRNLMMHPLLMPDGGLVVHDSSPLARVDACGRVEWVVDGIFHHSVERDGAGNIWAVYRYPVPRQAHVPPTFDDEAVAEVSAGGRPLMLRRIADILDANGLSGAWRSHPYVDDPFHLNDVQPILADGATWRRGDLLLSLRNMSLVVLYRPSTGRVLWSRQGPWTMQHDVEALDDRRNSVFDNHWLFAAGSGTVDGTNRIAIVDLTTGRTSHPYDAATRRNDIMTPAQGRATPLPNGDVFVEETERGRLLRMSPTGVVRWRIISADAASRRYQLRWSRYLDPQTDGAAIRAAEHARCV